MSDVAQFPLQSVLLPGMPLDLHVFEPRYLQLLADVAAADNRFGVVLITRGSEVGGEDQRAEVGTLAEIRNVSQLDESRWAVEAEGTQRFQVTGWLPDDPYPCATIEPWTQLLGASGADAVDMARDAFGSFLELAEQLGADVSGVIISPDAAAALYEMTATLPLSAYDKYQVLAAETVESAARTLTEAIAGAAEIVRHQIGR